MKILSTSVFALSAMLLLFTAGCCCGKSDACRDKAICSCEKCTCQKAECVKDCKKAGCICEKCTCKKAECIKDCKKADGQKCASGSCPAAPQAAEPAGK